MPVSEKHDESADHPAESAAEKLFLEQAKAYYRDLRAAGENAPFGKGFQRCESFAVLGGRELVRKSLELASQENIEQLEKKRKSENVSAAEHENIAATRPNNP